MVSVLCAVEEHGRKYGAEVRYREGNMKLRDGNVLEVMLEEHELVDIRKMEEKPKEQVELQYNVLDATAFSIEQSTAEVLRVVTGVD
jgi:hypothetical protein